MVTSTNCWSLSGEERESEKLLGASLKREAPYLGVLPPGISSGSHVNLKKNPLTPGEGREEVTILKYSI